jgi:hypothetical protein
MIALSSETIRTALAAVALHASKDDTRPQLCAMRIEANSERVRFVATNGHTLAVQTLPGAPDTHVSETVPAATIKALIADAKANKAASYFVTEGQIARVGMRLEYTGVDGFPPYKQVVPAYCATPQSTAMGLQPEYMHLAAKTFETAYTGRNYPAVAVNAAGGLSPILFASRDVPGLVVVVMPVRLDADATMFEVAT